MTEIAKDRDTLIEQNLRLVDVAKSYYDPSMEYHNFDGHILETWEQARILSERCIDAGKTIDLSVVDCSVLFHDADLYKPLSKRYASEERRSAAIARRILIDFDYDPSQIIHVSDAIISTTYGIRPKTIEAAITKRADIGNVGGDYSKFIANGVQILRENIRLNGLVADQETVEKWLTSTQSMLSGQLRSDEPFGDFDLSETDKNCSVFRINGMKNIERLATESARHILSLVFRQKQD